MSGFIDSKRTGGFTLLKSSKIRATVSFLIVNGITALRFVLASLFISLLLQEYPHFWVYLILFFIIAGSDYIDGKLARRWNAVSKMGEILDVSADFFFIFATSLVLYIQNVFPVWMPIIIALKLTEFILTSRFCRKKRNQRIFFFDPIGHFTAVSFYILPIITIFLRGLPRESILWMLHFLVLLLTVIAAISSFFWRQYLFRKEYR